MRVASAALLALALLSSLSSRFASEDREEDREDHRQLSGGAQSYMTQAWRDLDGVFKDYKPFLPNVPLIMFWRPQKVGSSTILSLLTSYAFRYNLLSRLRSSSNFVCRKIAKCALEHLQSDHRNSTNYAEYAHYLEDYVNGVQQGSGTRRQGVSFLKRTSFDMEKVSELTGPYTISTNHELCNLDSDLISENLRCAFSGLAVTREKPRNAFQNANRPSILDSAMAMTKNSEPAWRHEAKYASALPSVADDRALREIFVIRNPLSRAVSVYYFWGELFKLNHVIKHGMRKRQDKQNQNRRRLEIRLRLGQDSIDTGNVKGNLFTYHGNESTVPPRDLAMAFADRLPYIAGMPGPSYTWSAFARDKDDALRIIKSDRMMTIVTERLDESLVVARHYLGWSLADVVVTMYRKALSTHPKYTAWPAEAVATLKKKLTSSGEMAVFDAGIAKLDARIASLKSSGINVSAEVKLLQDLRKRVTAVCLSQVFLERYRKFIESMGFQRHTSENKLRDAEDAYTEGGHAFAYNREILYSFDVCGSCESHAILYGVEQGGDVNAVPMLAELRSDNKHSTKIKALLQFKKCPG